MAAGSEQRERQEKFVVAVRRNHIANTGNAITAVRRRSTCIDGVSRYST